MSNCGYPITDCTLSNEINRLKSLNAELVEALKHTKDYLNNCGNLTATEEDLLFRIEQALKKASE